jgi:hypothetical protein
MNFIVLISWSHDNLSLARLKGYQDSARLSIGKK